MLWSGTPWVWRIYSGTGIVTANGRIYSGTGIVFYTRYFEIAPILLASYVARRPKRYYIC